MTARKPPSTVTSYHNWEGDACRLHKGKDGQLTADIYRAGKGLLPISPTDLFWGAREIGYSSYHELVEEEIALHETKTVGSVR